MNFVDLTMPLNHRWMPDEGLPTAIKFFLGPKNHQEKGMVVGSDSGTSLALPALFTEFRKTTRLDQVPVEKLFLRPAAIANINKGAGEEISKFDAQQAFNAARPAKGDALVIVTGWGDKPHHQAEGNEYVLSSPHFSLEAAQYLAQAMRDNDNDLPNDVLDRLAARQESPIRIMRKHRGLTQDELAKKAGISRPYLTEIETGKKDGSIRAMRSLAKILNVNVGVLT